MAEAIVTPISEKSFRFNVRKISELNSVWSPEAVVQDVPWKVHVCKKTHNGKQSLGIYLHSAENDKPLNWTHAACATFKLLPFDNKLDAVKRNIKPYVFTNNGNGTGHLNFIPWADLFDNKKCYVKDDTINLKIKIVAEEANKINRSQLNIEDIDMNCECGCVANIRLIVRNINNLMAVKSSKFELRNIPWNLMVCNHSSKLGLRLECNKSLNGVSCKIKMSVKLVSSKDGVNPIEEVYDKNAGLSTLRNINGICSWDELLKPENGFVTNDSIELQVKIEAEKLEGNIPDDIQIKDNRTRMECAICLESIRNQNVSSTSCGHLFCTACITPVLSKQPVCPSCGAQAPLDGLRRTYMPIIN